MEPRDTCRNAYGGNSINSYPTSYLPRSGSFVESLHVSLLTNIQWSIDKHLKERQTSSLVDLPCIESILEISKYQLEQQITASYREIYLGYDDLDD